MKNQPINVDDEKNIAIASRRPDRMYVKDKTLYLAGTDWSNPQDIDANARNMLGNIKSSYKYNLALQKIFNNDIHSVVGFSLGGAIADCAASNVRQIKNARVYNSPSITSGNAWKKHIFYHRYDPIYGLFKREITPEMKVYRGSKYGHTMSGHKMIY